MAYEPLLATEPTPQARHQAVGAITLIPLLLNLLVSRQINLSRQWRPATHPCVDLLRLVVSGQRLQPVDVVAIHDPWLVVEMRRDRRGNDGLGSGDLFRRLAGSPCLRFGGSSHALGVIRTVTTEGHRDGTRICSVRRRHHHSELRLSGNGVKPRSQPRPRSDWKA